MKKYEHILVAVDFSDASEHVLADALDIAKQFSASVSLIHVVEPIPSYGLMAIPEIQGQLEQNAHEELKLIAEKYSLPADSLHVMMGSVKSEILRVADEIGADLVIVGSHSSHGLQHLLGSTASAICHSANIDVMVLRWCPE